LRPLHHGGSQRHLDALKIETAGPLDALKTVREARRGISTP